MYGDMYRERIAENKEQTCEKQNIQKTCVDTWILMILSHNQPKQLKATGTGQGQTWRNKLDGYSKTKLKRKGRSQSWNKPMISLSDHVESSVQNCAHCSTPGISQSPSIRDISPKNVAPNQWIRSQRVFKGCFAIKHPSWLQSSSINNGGL